MTETPDNHPTDISDAIGFFLTEAGNATNTATAAAYRKAAASLRRFAEGRPLRFGDFDEPLLDGWLTALFINGNSHKVATYYLRIISALYNRAVTRGIAPPTEAFRTAARRLDAISGLDYDISRREADHKRLVAMARGGATSPGGHLPVYADIFLASVLSGNMTPSEVARLKKADTGPFPPEMQAILSRHTGNRRSYVFDLRQPEMTGRQLDRTVDRNTAAVMRLHGISGTPTQAPADLWAHAALKCGYTPQAITGCLGFRPTANPVFALCPMQPIPDSDAMEMRATVARVITDDPLQWFVMRLRPASGFSSLLQRLASIPSGNHAPTLFYPCEEIATRIGRRLVWRDRPVIPDIVFFRSRRSHVRPLFREIGDLAWCYTTGRSGTYAAIPDSEMQRFQQAIGQFTPEYEIYPAGTLTPAEGESVVIIGGLFTGQQGEIEKIMPGNADSIIYRVVFPDSQGIEWRVNVDSRLIRKADATPHAATRQAYNQPHA